MNYDFTVTIERKINNSSMGFRTIFDGTQDLDEIFMPKIVSMLLKEWANTLEEKHAIRKCPLEMYRAMEQREEYMKND